jgi:hypothetical protein
MQSEQGISSFKSIDTKVENTYGINVSKLIDKYDIKDTKTKEVLQKFPTLCFLLGNVTDKPQAYDSRPDGVNRPVFYLTEGSGMFGLKNPEDADRWKGIFNHIMGSSRHAYFLSEKFLSLTDVQRNHFFDLGFDLNSFEKIDPVFLRDFMFVAHAARRQVEERKWHNLKDNAHPEGESEPLTTSLLIKKDAPKEFMDLMRVENSDYLMRLGKVGHFLNIVTNILTYCDWTFSQKPTTLHERFKGLRGNQRQPGEILDVFEKCANYFEGALKKVFGSDISQQMIKIGPYDWENQVREAYCSPSGLDINKIFPAYNLT